LARYRFAAKFLKKGMKVLDIGCGTGYGTATLAKEGNVVNAVGVDSDQEAVKFAQTRFGKRVRFTLGNAENLKFPDESFEIVCAFETIEHLDHPKKILFEVKRVLKRGGKLILSTPNKVIHSPGGKILSPYHKREYNQVEFSNILKEFFSKVEFFGQSKSKRARLSMVKFMESQRTRQKFVNMDVLGLRKIFPKMFKEKFWRYLGKFFGRENQELLDYKDFPITKNLKKGEYLIAICKKL